MKQTNNLLFAGMLGIVLAAGIGWYFFMGPGMSVTMDHGSSSANPSGSTGSSKPSTALDNKQVIKVKAAGGNLSQTTLEQIAKLKEVNDVRGYLTVQSGAIDILGVDVSKPLILEAGGKFMTPGVLEGRLFQSTDAGKKVMLAGKGFAGTNKTAYGYPILGMAGMKPPFVLDNNEVAILGVYETGSAETDNFVILPLDTVQQLYGETGVNVLYITLQETNNRSSVINQVKQVVGTKVEIQ